VWNLCYLGVESVFSTSNNCPFHRDLVPLQPILGTRASSPATIAGEMGIAREQLSAWLSRHHIDYAGWLNRLRIEKAKELLNEHPEWSNEAVARECGFTDRSYFQRKFKELTGRTPADWRESSKK